MLRHLVLNLACQGALDLDEDPVFGYSVGRPAQKGPLGVSHEPNFMSLFSVTCIVQITGHGFETRPVSRGRVALPGRLEHLFTKEIIGALITVLS